MNEIGSTLNVLFRSFKYGYTLVTRASNIFFIGVHGYKHINSRFYFDNVVFIHLHFRMKWEGVPRIASGVWLWPFFFLAGKIRLHQLPECIIMFPEYRNQSVYFGLRKQDLLVHFWSSSEPWLGIPGAFWVLVWKFTFVPILLSIQPVVAINQLTKYRDWIIFSFYCLQAPKGLASFNFPWLKFQYLA